MLTQARVAAAAGLVVGVFGGMALAARDYEPYAALKDTLAVELFGSDPSPPAPPQPDTVVADAGPARLAPLRIRDRATGIALRGRLRRAIWGRTVLDRPQRAYASGVATELSAPLAGVSRTDRLVVRQAFGIDSRIELHVPAGSPRGFVIVHGGHADLEDGMRPMLESLSRRGYVVAAMNMPLIGWNPQPVVHLPEFGSFRLTTHDLLPLLSVRSDTLLALFLDPVVAAIDRAQRMGFETVDMVGLSGGAWTTTLSAALDRRIQRSYALAGSVPMAMRSATADQGDFEQIEPPLYRLADYTDLYALGALETGRRHVELHNDRDPCCFALRSTPVYAGTIRAALERIGGGSFDVEILSSATHTVGPDGAATILREMDAG